MLESSGPLREVFAGWTLTCQCFLSPRSAILLQFSQHVSCPKAKAEPIEAEAVPSEPSIPTAEALLFCGWRAVCHTDRAPFTAHSSDLNARPSGQSDKAPLNHCCRQPCRHRRDCRLNGAASMRTRHSNSKLFHAAFHSLISDAQSI